MASLPYPRSHTIGGHGIPTIPTQPTNIKHRYSTHAIPVFLLQLYIRKAHVELFF